MRYLAILGCIVCLALYTIALFNACADLDPLAPDPRDAAHIEGRWQAQPPAHPEWRYDFDNPHLRQWIVDFGGQITEQEYIYATHRDTLFISGAGGQRTWLLHFPTDSTCEYREWAVFKWSPPTLLKRLP